LTHTSGLPIVFAIKPDMYVDRLDEMVAAVCANIRPSEPPGERVAYSPWPITSCWARHCVAQIHGVAAIGISSNRTCSRLWG